MSESPEIIYLQWIPDIHAFSDEITWCEDQINDDDVEYIRADKVALLREALGAVEWVGTDHPETGERIYRCPWCGATIIDNKVPPHNPPCKRQQALTATAPAGEGG